MTVWFTSDLHIGHQAVAYARRYGNWPADRSLVTDDDVAWHDRMLADRWDDTVKSADVVWVLGDLIANDRHLPEALDWVGQRPGVKHLILGNHDPAHPMHKDAHKHQRSYFRVFDSVQTAAKRRIAGHTVLLSHFPYRGDGDGKEADRDTQWRLREEGLPLLHGHIHSKVRLTLAVRGWATDSAFVLTGPLQIHVGVDAWDFAPVSLDTIAGMLNEAKEKEVR